MKENEQSVKEKFLNLIMDNGVALSISIAFCFALYYILQQQNELLIRQIYKLIDDKQLLIDQLLECYKYNKE